MVFRIESADFSKNKDLLSFYPDLDKFNFTRVCNTNGDFLYFTISVVNLKDLMHLIRYTTDIVISRYFESLPLIIIYDDYLE